MRLCTPGRRLGGIKVDRASQLPAPGRKVNGYSHKMFCCCLSLRPFPWSRRTAVLTLTLRCIFMAQIASKDNNRFVLSRDSVIAPDRHRHSGRRVDSSPVFVAKISSPARDPDNGRTRAQCHGTRVSFRAGPAGSLKEQRRIRGCLSLSRAPRSGPPLPDSRIAMVTESVGLSWVPDIGPLVAVPGRFKADRFGTARACRRLGWPGSHCGCARLGVSHGVRGVWNIVSQAALPVRYSGRGTSLFTHC